MDIQIKCGDIADEILNVEIEAERTFKYGEPKRIAVRRHSEKKPSGGKNRGSGIATYYLGKHPVHPFLSKATNSYPEVSCKDATQKNFVKLTKLLCRSLSFEHKCFHYVLLSLILQIKSFALKFCADLSTVYSKGIQES